MIVNSTRCRICRARMVGRELEYGHALQLLSPIAQLALQNSSLQPLPLPDREVGKLYWQFRERRGAMLNVSGIQGCQLANKDPIRPRVRHDMMHGEQQSMLVLTEADKRRAQEGTARQVKRLVALGKDQRLRFVFLFFCR